MPGVCAFRVDVANAALPAKTLASSGCKWRADYSWGMGFPRGRDVATVVLDSDGRSVMIEQFTGGAQRAVVRAAEEARRLDHQHIGTEHLLLGILHDGQGAAATALAGSGVSLDAVRRQVEEAIGRGVGRSGAHLPFTMPAQQAIEYALAEAQRRAHGGASAEHLLLGLLQDRDDTAVHVLVALGADADLAHRRLIESLPRGLEC